MTKKEVGINVIKSGLCVDERGCEMLFRIHDARMFNSLAELERFLIDGFICYLVSGTAHGHTVREVDDDGNIIEEKFIPACDNNESITIRPEWLRYYMEDRMSPYCLVARIDNDKFFYISHNPFENTMQERRYSQERYLRSVYHLYFDYIADSVKENLPATHPTVDFENYFIRFKPIEVKQNKSVKYLRPSIS